MKAVASLLPLCAPISDDLGGEGSQSGLPGGGGGGQSWPSPCAPWLDEAAGSVAQSYVLVAVCVKNCSGANTNF